MENDEKTTKALGRPFTMGMLYDCRSDKLIPGVTLWKSEVLDKNLREHPITHSKTNIFTSDTLKDKADALEMSAELKLSVLSGLVDLSGSGSYFGDHQENSETVRVILKYESRSVFKQLPMEHLGALSYLNIFDNKTATHVVTGIEYGADAFFVFEKSVSNMKDNTDTKGQLQASISKLKELAASGEAKVKYSDGERKEEEDIKCMFYGDVELENVPTSYQTAMEVMKNLPSRLKGQKVPKKVYLHPLSGLNSSAAKLARSINLSLIDRVQNEVQAYLDVTNEIVAIQKKADLDQIEFIQTETLALLNGIQTAKEMFKENLLLILPKIRGGRAEEKELSDLLHKWSSSALAPSNFTHCLKTIQSSLLLLRQFIKECKKNDISYIFGSDLEEYVTDFDNQSVCAFAFNRFVLACKRLKEIKQNLISGVVAPSESNNEWNKLQNARKDINAQFSSFRGYCKENSGKDGDIKFILTEITDEADPLPAATLFYECGSKEKISLPEPPGEPETAGKDGQTTTPVKLRWLSPDDPSGIITGYKVSVYEEEASDAVKTQGSSSNEVVITDLRPGKHYRFAVQSQTKVGLSPLSPQSKKILILTEKRLATSMLLISEPVRELNAKIEIYTPKDRRAVMVSEQGLEKYEIGKTNPMHFREKSIMVVGATGTGKTTFVNSLVNYLYEVRAEDDFRFKIITQDDDGKKSAQSRTKKVTSYTLNDTKLPYKLVVVDTPGYGDTEGLDADKRTTGLIKKLFEGKGKEGIDHLDAVCLFVKATDTRLTAQQRHNFNSVLQLFGKDLADNIFIIATFCDASEPPVKMCLKEDNISYKHFFKLNNSAFFEGPKENQTEQQAQAFYWQVGQESFDNLFQSLEKMKPVSLVLSAKVLTRREQLENLVIQLQLNVTNCINDLETMRAEYKIIEKFEAQITANKNFTYTVTENVVKMESIKGQGIHTTTCMFCNFTCHKNCIYSDDADKQRCCAIRDSNCINCPGKCYWEEHKNVPYIYVTESVTRTKTSYELKKKYKQAEEGVKKKEAMMDSLGEQFGQKQMDIFGTIKSIKSSLEELQKIAHRPSYLTNVQYIETLIESEKSQPRPGHKERIKHLEEQRNLAIQIKEAQDPNFDPFIQYRKEKGGWSRFMNKFKFW